MSEELDSTEFQRLMVHALYAWAQENKPAIQKAVAIGIGILEGVACAATVVRTWLEQPEVASTLAMVGPAILRLTPHLAAAAAAAARLYERRYHVICAMGDNAFRENDRTAVRHFTCEVLGLESHYAGHVFEALATSNWRSAVDPLTFIKRRAQSTHRGELRKEYYWANRHALLLDAQPANEKPIVVAVAEVTEKRLLTAEERVDLQRVVAEGELTEDAALVLHARLEGLSRTSWRVLGWDKQRLERAWKALDRATPLLGRKLR